MDVPGGTADWSSLDSLINNNTELVIDSDGGPVISFMQGLEKTEYLVLPVCVLMKKNS